jgi:hypothetical protein
VAGGRFLPVGWPAGPPEGARWMPWGWLRPTVVTRSLRREGLRPRCSAGREG